MRRILLLALAAVAISGAAQHTVNEIQFPTGHWTGGQGVDQLEEIWSNPANGGKIGMYREMQEGKTTFYEFPVNQAGGFWSGVADETFQGEPDWVGGEG